MSASRTRIRVGGTIALPAYIAAHAGSPSRVLHEAGVVETELRDTEGWLPLDRMAALYEAAARELRDPYFGLLGEVADLPPEPQALDSGSKTRVLGVKLDSGEKVVVPRANVELIEV